MCGKETSGFLAADPTLYQDKPFVITPSQRSSGDAIDRAFALARDIGTRPMLLDAERHDRIVAAISHLPFMAASALVQVIQASAEEDEQVWRLAASGFRDATRLAASDTTMMLDILLTNPDNVARLVRLASERLADLAAMLEEGRADELANLMKQAAQCRRAWPPSAGRAGLSREEQS